MKKYSLRAIVLTLFLLVSMGGSLARAQGEQPGGAAAVQAAVGTAFTYQGQLTDETGSPLEGDCDFRFRLWNDLTTGAQIGADSTAAPVAVTGGYFTARVNAAGEFGAMPFASAGRWLEVGVRCPAGSGNYTTLTPRQALTPAPVALSLPGLWTQETGNTPNIIGGYSGNSVAAGVYAATISGGGYTSSINQVTSNFGTVGGGAGNSAGGQSATVAGGNNNSAAGGIATVSGGQGNSAAGGGSFVGGGWSNSAAGSGSFVGGGGMNDANGDYAFVGGGYGNVVTATYGVVGGGLSNFAVGDGSFVGGGGTNGANGQYAAVNGGYSNAAAANYAAVSGGESNMVTADYAAIGGGYQNTAGGSSAVVGGGLNNSANGQNAALVGGVSNSAAGNGSFVGGGSGNSATALYPTIGGGYTNLANGDYTTVGGGNSNAANASSATVGGGWDNEATAIAATVGGGLLNSATDNYAVVGGGYNNIASGMYAAVLGGYRNSAGGDASFAGGTYAQADHQGSFVWGDASTTTPFTTMVNNQFLIHSTGGMGINTNDTLAYGLTVNGQIIGGGVATGAGGYEPFVARGSNAGISLDDRANGAGGRWVIYANDDVLNFWNTYWGNKFSVDSVGVVTVYGLGGAGGTALCLNSSNQIAYCSSSARYKTDIAPLGMGLDVISRLRPVTFTWKEGGAPDLGLVAEEVYAVAPLLTTLNAEGEIEGVKYDRLGTVLVAGMQEQQAQIEALEEANAALEARLAALEQGGAAGLPAGASWIPVLLAVSSVLLLAVGLLLGVVLAPRLNRRGAL